MRKLACYKPQSQVRIKDMHPRLCHSSLRSYHKQHQTWGKEEFMQCLQRIREGTTTWRVWTCWPEADATWASVCNWTAVTPPCCWEQEQEELEMCQEGNVWFKTWDYLPLTGEGGSHLSTAHPTEDFQTVQTPYTKVVLLKVAGLKIISLVSPKWNSKHTSTTQKHRNSCHH